MINNIRTILLNEDGPHTEDSTVAGDQYIPEYTGVELTGDLARIYDVLFGSQPDYEGRVYRMGQYMAIVHSTEYAAYVVDPDPRITYNARNSGVMDEGLYGIVTGGPSELTINGTLGRPEDTGRITTHWRILAVDSSNVAIDNTTDGIIVTYALGDTKTLPGSSFIVAFDDQDITAGDRWDITHRTRVQPDLGVVLSNLQALPDGVLTPVFGSEPREEPFLTFYNMFKQDSLLPFQLTGMLLGLAYRIQELSE